MLTRLKLPGLRDQLDTLLDEATRHDLSMRETLALLCEREIARTRVNRHQAAQMRPVTRITAASSVSSAPSAVDRPDDTLFRGARDNEQTLNARPADQL
jgi:hypothetical protein